MRNKQNDNDEEQEFVGRIICRQQSCYREMMTRYGQRVMSLVSRMVSDSRDAEELAQDAFVRAFTNISTYDATKSSLSTWLLRIAYNVALNHLRRKHPKIIHIYSWMEERRKETDEEDDRNFIDENGDIYTDDIFCTGNEQHIRMLEKCIDTLPVEERTLLSLYYYDNLPMQEISQILGYKPSTLSLRMFRIRRKLRNMIEGGLKKKNIHQ